MGIERDYLDKKVEKESTSFSMERQMKLANLREYLNRKGLKWQT